MRIVDRMHDSEKPGYFVLSNELSKIRTEAAAQARKEERIKTIEEVKSKIHHAMSCYAFSSVLDQMLENSVLSQSVTQGKTDAEKLAIAVKALKKIKQLRKACPAFESHFSKLQDIGAITNDALKEIQ